VLDDQSVDFNLRLHTGQDDLDQDGIRLTPTHFNTTTLEYELSAYFYQLLGLDAFTLTAQVTDLDGHTNTLVATADDTTPPGRVTGLTAQRRADGSIDLIWLAPGDSGSVGTANVYDIRFATTPIDSFSWYSATPLPDTPLPLAGGTRQTWNVPGPWPENIYFALKAVDPEGNISLLSNSAQATWRTMIPIVAR
jgi:hypothetical protein